MVVREVEMVIQAEDYGKLYRLIWDWDEFYSYIISFLEAKQLKYR